MEVHEARAELCCQHLDPSHQAVKVSQQTELVDEDAMSQIRKGHDTMCVVLTSRHKNLDTVRAVWTTGDIKASASPCHHTMVGFTFISSILTMTSCHILSTYLRTWPCTHHFRGSPINTPQQTPSSHHRQSGATLSPVLADRCSVCTDISGLCRGHQ